MRNHKLQLICCCCAESSRSMVKFCYAMHSTKQPVWRQSWLVAERSKLDCVTRGRAPRAGDAEHHGSARSVTAKGKRFLQKVGSLRMPLGCNQKEVGKQATWCGVGIACALH